MTTPERRAARLYALFLPVFFLSGFAALLYQIVWQRLLSFFSGADVYSVTLIVTVFMGGLGFGSLAGGHLADRLSPRRRLLAFAAAEAAVGLFALLSVALLYRGLFLGLGEREMPIALTTLLLFAVLLWPTFFMGLSLPLLARVLTESAERAAQRIGGLYGWNTLGAGVGSLATVWWLVRSLGFEGAIHVGAVLNFGCALVALAALRALPAAETQAPAPAPQRADTPPARVTAPLAFRSWLAIYALSGFVALSLEIVWFRLLGTILKSNSFTFATLLALFLAGLGAGALVGSRLARSSSRPAAAFLALQSAIPLYAALSLAVFLASLGRVGPLEPVLRHLAEYESVQIDVAIRSALRYVQAGGEVAPHTRNVAHTFLLLYGVVPAALILPPTLLMGMSFPFLQRQVQTDLAGLGRRVGWLQTANIVGSMAGAGLTGLLLLRVLGTAWTLRALVGLGLVFLLLLVRVAGPAAPARRALAAGAALAVTLAAAAASPSAPTLWARLHGTTPERILFAEDGSGVALLKEEGEPRESRTVVYVTGLGQSHLPYGGYHTLLGALPVLLHPRPEAVAVIGLGSGSTLFGIGGREETQRIDCIEIIEAQLPSLRRLARQRRYSGLEWLLLDGRVSYAFTDGRSFLMRGDERYDVIEADALRPDSAYAGNLYSVEYFDLVRRRLRPGGLGITWCPTPRVRDTFLRVFPHVLELGPTLLGSDAPIPYDPDAIRARTRDPFTRTYYRRGGVDIEALLEPTLRRPGQLYGPETERPSLADLNTDLFPRDEYLTSVSLLPRRARSAPREP